MKQLKILNQIVLLFWPRFPLSWPWCPWEFWWSHGQNGLPLFFPLRSGPGLNTCKLHVGAYVHICIDVCDHDTGNLTQYFLLIHKTFVINTFVRCYYFTGLVTLGLMLIYIGEKNTKSATQFCWLLLPYITFSLESIQEWVKRRHDFSPVWTKYTVVLVDYRHKTSESWAKKSCK